MGQQGPRRLNLAHEINLGGNGKERKRFHIEKIVSSREEKRDNEVEQDATTQKASWMEPGKAKATGGSYND